MKTTFALGAALGLLSAPAFAQYGGGAQTPAGRLAALLGQPASITAMAETMAAPMGHITAATARRPIPGAVRSITAFRAITVARSITAARSRPASSAASPSARLPPAPITTPDRSIAPTRGCTGAGNRRAAGSEPLALSPSAACAARLRAYRTLGVSLQTGWSSGTGSGTAERTMLGPGPLASLPRLRQTSPGRRQL